MSSIRSASVYLASGQVSAKACLLPEVLSEILHGAGNHQPGVGEIEALRDGSRKIEGRRDYHFACRTREVEGDVVAEHTPIVLQR